MRPYQRERVLTFIDPDRDPWARVITSSDRKSRLVPAGFSARAICTARRTASIFPAQHTDFIFAVFSEEWGFVGCFILLACYFAFIVYGLKVVERAKDRMGALLVFGTLSIIFWHVVINVAMVAGVLPVVGVPLPLFSYGGSALATMMFAIGLMINVSMRRYIF